MMMLGPPSFKISTSFLRKTHRFFKKENSILLIRDLKNENVFAWVRDLQSIYSKYKWPMNWQEEQCFWQKGLATLGAYSRNPHIQVTVSGRKETRRKKLRSGKQVTWISA